MAWFMTWLRVLRPRTNDDRREKVRPRSPEVASTACILGHRRCVLRSPSAGTQEAQHRVGVSLRLLDIGNMRGVEQRELRARDVVLYSFASGVVAGSCLPAMTRVGALIFGNNSRWSMSRTASPQAI